MNISHNASFIQPGGLNNPILDQYQGVTLMNERTSSFDRYRFDRSIDFAVRSHIDIIDNYH